MAGAGRVSAPRVEMRAGLQDSGEPPGNDSEPESGTRCPCCGSRLQQKGVKKIHVASVLVGVVLAIVGFGVGSGSLSVGASGTFGNSVAGVVLVVAGVVSFLWGLAEVLSHVPAAWECPSCGYRRDGR